MKLRKHDEFIWVMTRSNLDTNERRYLLHWITGDSRTYCWMRYHLFFEEPEDRVIQRKAEKIGYKAMRFKLVPVK